MKRRALLIGNSRGLVGVKRDMVNFQVFLMEKYGGAWKRGEITTLMNPSLTELRSKLNAIKAENNDFVIVLFSGHGGYQRGTVLEINGNEETIYDSELMQLAPRQVPSLIVAEPCATIQKNERCSMSRNSFLSQIQLTPYAIVMSSESCKPYPNKMPSMRVR